ncbi:TIGR04086 family membrane protein [Clostridium sp. DL1XJH146]
MKKNIFYISEGVIRGFFLTMVLLFVYSILSTYFNVIESFAGVYIVIVTALSIMYATIFSVSRIKTRGWVNGIIVALVYMVIIYLISVINGRAADFSVFGIIRVILSLAVGMFSGMLSVNMD